MVEMIGDLHTRQMSSNLEKHMNGLELDKIYMVFVSPRLRRPVWSAPDGFLYRGMHVFEDTCAPDYS